MYVVRRSRYNGMFPRPIETSLHRSDTMTSAITLICFSKIANAWEMIPRGKNCSLKDFAKDMSSRKPANARAGANR